MSARGRPSPNALEVHLNVPKGDVVHNHLKTSGPRLMSLSKSDITAKSGFQGKALSLADVALVW